MAGGLWSEGFSVPSTCSISFFLFFFAEKKSKDFDFLAIPYLFSPIYHTRSSCLSHLQPPSLSDSYPMPRFSCVYFFALYLCCAFVCFLVCVYEWPPLRKAVSSAHPRVLHSYPHPLYPSTFSLHVVVYLWKVTGGLLNSLVVSLSFSRECGCGGDRGWTLWSLRAVWDTCSLVFERH